MSGRMAPDPFNFLVMKLKNDPRLHFCAIDVTLSYRKSAILGTPETRSSCLTCEDPPKQVYYASGL